MRRFWIAAAAVALCILCYTAYQRWTGPSSAPLADEQTAEPLTLPEPTGQAGAGQLTVHSAEQSFYVLRDADTKRIKQIFGFQRLLNPQEQGSRWLVEKPYMIYFQSGAQFRLDADRGQFQIERTAGGVSPKDAQLEGNVTIHLTPLKKGDLPAAVLRFERLLFSSERSEFTTDGPVELQSSQAYLKGKGLILLLDTLTGRMDYLNLLSLETLRLKNQPYRADMQDAAEKDSAVSDAQPDISQPATQTEQKPLYQCSFNQNVLIQVGNQLVALAEKQAQIFRIPLGSGSKEPTETADSGAEQFADAHQPMMAAPPSADQVDILFDFDPSRDIQITCSGGVVLELAKSASSGAIRDYRRRFQVGQPSVRFDGIANWQTVAAVSALGATEQADASAPAASRLTDTLTAPSGQAAQPARFEAQKIAYDYQTGVGRAIGPVKLTFYQPADADSGLTAPYWPMEIVADGDAEFLPDGGRRIQTVIFSKQVYGQRVLPFATYQQRDAFNADKMTVYLDAVGGKTSIRRLVLSEGDVFAESRRVREQEKLSHVRLSSRQLEYLADGRLIAQGPGQIEVDNSKASLPTSDNGNLLERPSYAYLKGFDSINWLPDQQQLIADSGGQQLELSYIPLKDDQPEKLLRAAAGKVILSMAEQDGSLKLAALTAAQRVYFEEQGRYLLEGAELVYDVQNNGWLTIVGTEQRPCMANGARVPYIHYHLPSGQLETKLAATPSYIPAGR